MKKQAKAKRKPKQYIVAIRDVEVFTFDRKADRDSFVKEMLKRNPALEYAVGVL